MKLYELFDLRNEIVGYTLLWKFIFWISLKIRKQNFIFYLSHLSFPVQ